MLIIVIHSERELELTKFERKRERTKYRKKEISSITHAND